MAEARAVPVAHDVARNTLGRTVRAGCKRRHLNSNFHAKRRRNMDVDVENETVAAMPQPESVVPEPVIMVRRHRGDRQQ